MQTSPPFFRPLAVAAAAALIAACGGGGSDPAPPTAPPGTTPPPLAAGPQVLVQVDARADIAALAAARGATVVDRFGRRPIYRLQLPAGTDADAVAADLRRVSGVVFAEANADSETPEGARNSFWAIGRTATDYAQQWAPQALRLAGAHAVTTGAGVRVAVLDTGIVAGHPVFAGRLLPGRDFVDGDADPAEEGSTADAGYGHGTHVAGLVALAAPGARIVPLRVLDPAGRGNHWVLAEALLHAVDPDGDPATDDGAHVVNMSLGSTRATRMLALATALASCEFDDEDDDDLDHPGFDDDRARCARGHGAAVLSAAGNDASDQVEIFPAAEQAAGARAITATRSDDFLADFANAGGWIKLAAPGEAIVSAVPGDCVGGCWGTWSGTSMAAPLAAGAAALALTTPAPNPRQGVADPLRRWTAEDLMKRLEDRAKPVCGASVKQIDAAAAVTDTPPLDPACP